MNENPTDSKSPPAQTNNPDVTSLLDEARGIITELLESHRRHFLSEFSDIGTRAELTQCWETNMLVVDAKRLLANITARIDVEEVE